MNEIKIYEDRCLSCSDSQRFDVIYFIAKKYGLKVNRRRVYVFPELQQEAEELNTQMPFIALNNKTMDFYTIGTYLLEDKALEDFIKNEKSN